MIRPDGSDSLVIRQRYLKRQRRNYGERLMTASWVAGVATLAWLFIAGFASLSH